MSMNRQKADRPAARFVIKGTTNGLYVKELVRGVTPVWTSNLREAATYASKSYADAKIGQFGLAAKVRPVAMKVGA